MAVGLLQSGTSASAAASPTSIAPSLPAPSTAGNLLILVVVSTGTSPTITPPSGSWLTLGNNASGSLARGVFYMFNNPGGIQAPVSTVSATGGGAAAAIFEFSGFGGTVPFDFSNAPTGSNNAFVNPFLAAPQVAEISELWFVAVMFQAATLTPSPSPEWSAAIGAVSTNGTPNAQIACFWATNSGMNNPAISGGFSISTPWGIRAIRLPSQSSNNITYTNIGGLPGQLVGQFYQGMIGG